MRVVAEGLVVDGARRRVDLDVIRGGEGAVSSRSDADMYVEGAGS